MLLNTVYNIGTVKLPWPRIPTLADFPTSDDRSSATMTPSEDGSGIYITSTNSSSATYKYILTRPADLSVNGDYISARIQWNLPAANYRSARLAFKLSSGSWITFGPTYDAGNKMSVTEFNSSWGFTAHRYGPNATHYGKEYFRIIRVSGNIQFQVSSDGTSWTTVYTNSYTITNAGIMLDSSTSGDGGALKKISLLLWDEN